MTAWGKFSREPVAPRPTALDFGLWTLDLPSTTTSGNLPTTCGSLSSAFSLSPRCRAVAAGWTLDFGLWTLDFGLSQAARLNGRVGCKRKARRLPALAASLAGHSASAAN